MKEWQERPLEEVYALVFLDAIHFHVRSEDRIVKQVVYIAIGIDMSRKKDILGMYVGQNESAKFWLSILNGLHNRGVKDILIACVDGLTGFLQVKEAVYPQTELQQCIIHQIHNTTHFVSYKEINSLMVDLKKVYVDPTEETALSELDSFNIIYKLKRKTELIVIQYNASCVTKRKVRIPLPNTNFVEFTNLQKEIFLSKKIYELFY